MQATLTQNDEQLIETFHTLASIQDVADLLEVELSRLKYYLYWMPDEKRYLSFPIPKKSGGIRTILAPNTPIKILQRKLNHVFQLVYHPKPCVHGFIADRSIVSNAEAHMGRKRRYVLNIDLENFFPSINFGRVRGMFMGYPYELPQEVATVLAQICCFENQLPQGAPTSPTISNMLCAKMDSQLLRLAQGNRCFYTRYADDITFSTSISNFPRALAEIHNYPTGLQLEVGEELARIVRDNGFSINSSKVRLQTSDRRQEITGLVVNEKPNVPRKYIRQIRAMLHAWGKFGLDAAEQEYLTKYRNKQRFPSKTRLSFKAVLRGKIEYLGMVRGKTDKLYLRYLNEFKRLEHPNSAQPPIVATQGRVFISYSNVDIEFVRKLVTSFTELKINIWFDKKDILEGDIWSNSIQDGLDICNAMVVVITPDSMNSANVQREWLYYLTHKKHIITVLYKDSKIHFQLEPIQYIDFREPKIDYNTALAKLERALHRLDVTLKQF